MVVSWLAWPGAVAIGISLGLLGSGGSILTVPVLVYLVGQDEKLAIAGSLFVVGSIALAGSLQYLRLGLIDWRNVLVFGLPGMAGTWLGAWTAQFVSGLMQLSLFAVVMLLASWFMLRPVPLDPPARAPRATWKIGADGLVVGVLTGLVGVGGGFLIVPALVLLGGLPMHRAVATSLFIIALKSYSGFYKYLDVLERQSLELDWRTLFVVTALGVAGSFAGGFMANRLPQATLKRGFGYFLIVMGIYILWRSLPGALGLATRA
ncbi:MAG: sulfite exporter TauE/SafE family protein [Gammaproteobacteria bacterium]|nr:sulfite exporter TauE/SafE family protein [Gammaproteobacteria bacterium]MDH4253145.1 sulfite exporter TauE/SafE family protein [Gammaproteobacteria bacterium]MDH5308493.1 sulfite exporter TauE/SafE family protein [Gammaproteobacteria bacterium]